MSTTSKQEEKGVRINREVIILFMSSIRVLLLLLPSNAL